jgi:hypothetical protein
MTDSVSGLLACPLDGRTVSPPRTRTGRAQRVTSAFLASETTSQPSVGVVAQNRAVDARSGVVAVGFARERGRPGRADRDDLGRDRHLADGDGGLSANPPHRDRGDPQRQDDRVRSASLRFRASVPTRQLHRHSKTAQEVSDELGGLLSAHEIRKLARRGKIPGAFKLSGRVYFATNTATWLIRDLSSTGAAGYAITIPREGTDVDGFYKPPR